MLSQLKRLFGRSDRLSNRRSSNPAASRTGFKPAPVTSSAPRRVELFPDPVGAPAPVLVTNDEDISIPLQSVLNALPPDLKSCVIPMDLGGATLTVALHKVLSQLSSGAVKLSFGVLRGAAPQLFSIGAEFDDRDIELPLSELLVRINPILLPRPANQKAAITETIEDSFIVAATRSPGLQPVSKPPTAGPIRVPVPTTAPEPEIPTAPNPAFAKQPAASPARKAIVVSLDALAASWPAEVRAEIVQLKCTGGQVSLPEQLVELGMKQGKVAFPWQSVRAWINPTPPSFASKHDSSILNLPLEVLMPLFVSRLNESPKTQTRLVVDETIPALFSPATPPEVPDAESNEASSESAAQSNTSSDTAKPKPKTPSTDFKNRYISPSEVVTQASSLKGVAGALLVLPEGLLVAASVSTDQNPDALAAFLARALSRVNLCAEEAQIGELSLLEFTAQNIPWKIFRLHGVLFAAFGRADGTLPHPQLAALAGEFDRKKRG